MEDQPADVESAQIRDVVTASRSDGPARLLLTVLAYIEIAQQSPATTLADLARLTRLPAEGVRAALRDLNGLREIGYRIHGDEVYFEIIPMGAR